MRLCLPGSAAAALALLKSPPIDLDDLTGSTAAGLHLATMGGLWQALVLGFAGVRGSSDALIVDPRLPAAWESMAIQLRFRGARAQIRIRHDGVTVEGDPELRWEEGRP